MFQIKCVFFCASEQERVQLTRHVTEGNIVPIVAKTCDRLVRLCDNFTRIHYKM